MPIYSDADIMVLINAGEEHLDLDYKDSINLEGGKKEKVEITKDIIAMANSGGGLIIGGVRETPTGFTKTGMPREELAAFDSTKLNQFVNQYCDPPINSTTRIIEDGDKFYGVIIIPAFSDQPHIVTKNFSEVFSEGELLVRTSNNESRRAGPYELRELLNNAVARRQGAFQKLLQSAIQSVKPQILDQSQLPEITVPFDTQKALEKYKGFRIVRIQPVNGSSQIELLRIQKLVEQSSLTSRRSGEISFPSANPRYSNQTRLPIGIAYQFENEHYGYTNFSFFDISGNIFVTESLWEDTHGSRQPEGSLDVISCFQMIVESLVFAIMYYCNLDWEGQFRIMFSVESTIHRQLVHDVQGYWPLYRAYQCNMSIPVSVDRIVDMGIDLPTIETISIDMFRKFCWFFHYDIDIADAEKYLNYLKKKNLVIPRNLAEASSPT